MAELNSLEESQRQTGLLTEDAAPIKLAIVAKVPVEAKDDKPASAVATHRPALALGDDEDDGVVLKKKRAMVKLEYEQSLDAAEEAAKRAGRILDITKRLPSSKSSIFRSDINWAILDNVSKYLCKELTDRSPALAPRFSALSRTRSRPPSASWMRTLPSLSWSTSRITTVRMSW